MSTENITSARRCAKASILQFDDVTLLKHLVQNHSGFSDLKPEEYYDSAPRLYKLTFYSLTIQHLDKVWSSFLVLKICLSSNRLAVWFFGGLSIIKVLLVTLDLSSNRIRDLFVFSLEIFHLHMLCLYIYNSYRKSAMY